MSDADAGLPSDTKETAVAAPVAAVLTVGALRCARITSTSDRVREGRGGAVVLVDDVVAVAVVNVVRFVVAFALAAVVDCATEDSEEVVLATVGVVVVVLVTVVDVAVVVVVLLVVVVVLVDVVLCGPHETLSELVDGSVPLKAAPSVAPYSFWKPVLVTPPVKPVKAALPTPSTRSCAVQTYDFSDRNPPSMRLSRNATVRALTAPVALAVTGPPASRIKLAATYISARKSAGYTTFSAISICWIALAIALVLAH